MNKFLITAAALLTSGAMAVTALTKDGEYKINRFGKPWRDYNIGTLMYGNQQMGTYGSWKFTRDGGAANAILPVKDNDGRKIILPVNAYITKCFVGMPTLLTSATGSSSVSFGSNAVADLKAATFAAGYSTTALKACIPDGTVGNAVRMASEGFVAVKIGSEAATAGQLDVWVEYVINN